MNNILKYNENKDNDVVTTTTTNKLNADVWLSCHVGYYSNCFHRKALRCLESPSHTCQMNNTGSHTSCSLVLSVRRGSQSPSWKGLTLACV